jgi:formylglycine-generating enzyme required for sulfatase activity/predicted Ser/Thr protein kinase
VDQRLQLPALIGKYELLEYLGGGMSHVYRGRDTVIGRPVVVKILTEMSNGDPEARARFLQEARLAGNIQHENIVSVFDYGEHGGRPYLVMEYLKGENLRDAIRGGRLGGLEDRLRITQDIASALEYVHAQGIVHRDIKPENVHIDAKGRVKLMDFGIAKAADLSLTKAGMAMGTPFYMAPEQVQGRPTTPLVDIYAFGLLLYEVLTGVRGVNGDTMEALFYQILNVTLDPQTMANAGAPPAVSELVLRCTAKRPEDRPQSFAAVIEQLRAVRAGFGAAPRTLAMPATAAPVPEAKKEHVKTGSRPMLWIIAAVIVVAVAGGAWWVLGRAPAAPQIPGMVYVPAGTFLAGAEKKPTPLGAFYIDEAEVSNADFAEFCRATGCAAPQAAADLPVVNVTADQARAYAAWKGKRLPTALEWERAARGVNGALFPWGDELQPMRANVADNPAPAQHLIPVRSLGAYPEYQMIGNAWEMVEGSVTPSPLALTRFAALLNPPPTAQEPWISIRGGSFSERLSPALTYDSSSIPERYAEKNIGFRCAKTP